MTAMQQIADGLEKLGMSEYAERFAENDIDTSVLPEWTGQDLKDLVCGAQCLVCAENQVRRAWRSRAV